MTLELDYTKRCPVCACGWAPIKRADSDEKLEQHMLIHRGVCDRCFKPTTEGEHGWMKCPLEPRRSSPYVISDELPNGPYWCETLGHEPVWVESKSHLAREAKARNLECVGGRKSDHYFATQRKQHDERLRDEKRV